MERTEGRKERICGGFVMEKDKYVREMKRYFLDADTGERAGREILEHLEDKQEYYVQMGFSEAQAEKKAMEDLGNPEILGRKLNRCHPPGLDIQTLWTVLFTGFLTFLLHWVFIEHNLYFEKIPGAIERFLGLCGLYGFGIFFSVFEIWMGTQELYSIRTKEGTVMLWNSTYICGIGIGIAAQSWEEWMMLAAAGGLLALAVRTVVMKRQWSFANRYLFREGVLSKDTSYRGKAVFPGEHRPKAVFYYEQQEDTLKEGSPVVVGRVEGRLLIIQPESR